MKISDVVMAVSKNNPKGRLVISSDRTFTFGNSVVKTGNFLSVGVDDNRLSEISEIEVVSLGTFKDNIEVVI